MAMPASPSFPLTGTWLRPFRSRRKLSLKDFFRDFFRDIGLSSAFAMSAEDRVERAVTTCCKVRDNVEVLQVEQVVHWYRCTFEQVVLGADYPS